MDGVFDLFHTGPNETDFRGDGDKNATSYKRPPIIGEVNRSVIVGGLKLVDEVICQSPLVVGEGFLERHKIDIVVHAFCDG